MRVPKIILSGLALFILAGRVHAAGAYSENFNSGQATGWSSAFTWLVASSNVYGTSLGSDAYGNTSESSSSQESVAVYNNNSWTTDYTLHAKAYSTYGNAGDETKSGNRVGLVFNYTSSGNYYQVLVNMLGEVRLEQVSGGAISSPLAPLVRVTGIDNLQWFDIDITLAGSKVSVKVNGQQAISNVTLTGLAQSKIGVVSQFNLGFFDDISVTPTATAFFRTGFDGTTITAPVCSPPSTPSCVMTFSGSAPGTNFTWPAKVWDLSGIIQATTGPRDANAPFTDYIKDEIQTVTGHAGTPTSVFYQSIRAPSTQAGLTPQNPHYIYFNGEPIQQQGDLYIRYWVKLGSLSGLGSWRVLTQWKTDGDFRLNLRTTTFGQGLDPGCDSNGQAYWQVLADNVANGSASEVDYWEKCDKTHPIPIGQWFKIEFFTHRGTPGGTDGRVWVAINGQTYFDVRGEQMWGVSGTKKINRIMAPQLYTSAHGSASAPVEQWSDDLEIWDNFPSDASPH